MGYKRWCFVPGCPNNSTRTPSKKFLCVPRDLEKKKKWFEAVGRDIQGVSPKSSLYCCEDHFNVSILLIYGRYLSTFKLNVALTVTNRVCRKVTLLQHV